MKFGKIVKTVVKLAPIVYPIVRKALAEKKKTGTSNPNK